MAVTPTDPPAGDEKWLTAALDKNPPPEPLPTGWVIRASRSQHGAFFYYHQESGECRWEKPVVTAVKKSAPKAAAPKTAPKKHKAEAAAPAAAQASKKAKRSSSGTDPKEVRVLHILKKHKGSRRPASWRNPKITSTKEEATEELQGLVEVLTEVKDNPDELRATFEELARTESDCSSAKRGGDLGFFGRKKMQPTFEAGSFALKIGELSPIIESSSGVHVILRIG
jgi:NIMA-interacting peptidyl-prolyl cis-trans isomerase 1